MGVGGVAQQGEEGYVSANADRLVFLLWSPQWPWLGPPHDLCRPTGRGWREPQTPAVRSHPDHPGSPESCYRPGRLGPASSRLRPSQHQGLDPAAAPGLQAVVVVVVWVDQSTDPAELAGPGLVVSPAQPERSAVGQQSPQCSGQPGPAGSAHSPPEAQAVVAARTAAAGLPAGQAVAVGLGLVVVGYHSAPATPPTPAPDTDTRSPSSATPAWMVPHDRIWPQDDHPQQVPSPRHAGSPHGKFPGEYPRS